ncbi:acyl-CoA-like ligand-binding transcription factor [Actinomadura rupiterrae]|uniref:acyl-CoA-like ligand-binding transcription factor n=1 Tax=Actinomadura rupiterrae TaxID=559627 RepID=UPI0020A2C750|nr:TetR family transcriptional regulator [Actinomadura rupiterrae]MCP2337427.1 AcrR family transcriptional regulator [Actinomadura rupiterrae]
MENPADGPGLRERKKRETRLALARAALRLAVEQGIDNVRVDDIASAVNVSSRTFNNYFSSKEEAIVSLGVERDQRIADALEERPPAEPLGRALVEVFAEQYGQRGFGSDPEQRERLRLVLSSPALRGVYLQRLAAGERRLAEAIAHRLGADIDADAYPEALAAALSGAVRAAVTHWVRSGSVGDLPELVRRSVAQIVEGVGAVGGGEGVGAVEGAGGAGQ